MSDGEQVQARLAQLHAEALRVGDSPLRADRLADQLGPLLDLVAGSDLPDDVRSRTEAAIRDAERVLRRDDDGREAARHLQTAQRHSELRPRKPSPFLDD